MRCRSSSWLRIHIAFSTTRAFADHLSTKADFRTNYSGRGPASSVAMGPSSIKFTKTFCKTLKTALLRCQKHGFLQSESYEDVCHVIDKQSRDLEIFAYEFHKEDERVSETEQQANDPPKDLVAKGRIFTRFADMNSKLEMKVENLEAQLKEEKESSLHLQAEVASLRGKLLDSGDDVARLNSKVADEQESLTYFAQSNSRLNAEVEHLEARVREETQHSVSLAEELVRLRSNLDAETESCAYFSQKYEGLDTQVHELQADLRKAQSESMDGEKSTCQICLEQPRSALCMPCRHFVCCKPCLEDHLKRNKKCPVCRVLVEKTIECYT